MHLKTLFCIIISLFDIEIVEENTKQVNKYFYREWLVVKKKNISKSRRSRDLSTTEA